MANSITSLASRASLVFAARVVGLSAGVATQVLIARVLSADALGLYYFATGIAVFCGAVAALGYPILAMRLINRYRARRQPEFLAGFVRHARGHALGLALLLMGATLAFALALAAFDAEQSYGIAAAAVAIPAITMLRINGGIAASIRQFNGSFFPDLLYRPLMLLLSLAALAAMGLAHSTTAATTLFSASAMIVAIGQALWLSRHLVPEDEPSDRRVKKYWRSVSWSLLIVSSFTSLFADLDLALLGTVLTKSELAVFGCCLKLAFFVGFAIQVLHEFVNPEISECYACQQFERAQSAIARANFLGAAVTGLAILVAALLGPQLLRIFGPEFVSGYPMLVVLIGVQALRAAFGPSVTVLTAAGGQRVIAVIFWWSFLILIASNVALVPAFRTAGAVAAVAVTTAFWTAAIAIALYRSTGLRTDLLASSVHVRWVRPKAFG